MARRNNRAILVGAFLAGLGFILGYLGIAPLTEARDADGYYMSEPFVVDRPSRAIVTADMDLLRGRWETLEEESLVLRFMGEPDDVRMQGVASPPNALFMGIAPAVAVDEYFNGVPHDEITDWDADRATIDVVEYTAVGGAASPDVPGAETFWVASVSGGGPLTLDWTIESGDWMAVIMNADASSGVMGELAFGALPSSSFRRLSWAVFSLGLLLLVVGGPLLFWGLRRRRSRAQQGESDGVQRGP